MSRKFLFSQSELGAYLHGEKSRRHLFGWSRSHDDSLCAHFLQLREVVSRRNDGVAEINITKLPGASQLFLFDYLLVQEVEIYSSTMSWIHFKKLLPQPNTTNFCCSDLTAAEKLPEMQESGIDLSENYLGTIANPQFALTLDLESVD